MAARPVDFRGSVVADLPRGRIETRDHQRLVALPADLLESLVARAPADAVAALGTALGAALEPDARAALGDGADDASPEDVAYAVSAALATRGLGLARFERWGDALALVWRDPPGAGDAFGELAAAAVASLVGRLTGLDVSAAAVGRDGDELRVLVASRDACDVAREAARRGDAFPQIIARLERAPEGT